MSVKLFIPLLVFLLVEDPWAKAQDARIKLCGREFVRRVISSCGSSRGKRHTSGIDRPHWGIYSRCHFEKKRNSLWLCQPSWLSCTGPVILPTLLSLVHVFPGVLLDRLSSDQFSTSGNEEGQEQQLPQEGPAGHPANGTPAQDNGSPEGHGLLHSRFRRDTGPAGLCCRSGCTESELVQFCWNALTSDSAPKWSEH